MRTRKWSDGQGEPISDKMAQKQEQEKEIKGHTECKIAQNRGLREPMLVETEKEADENRELQR